MKKIESIVEKKQNKIIVFAILDILFLLLASFLALEIRFDFGIIPYEYMQAFENFCVIDCIIMLFIFLILKLYTSVWRFASITELLNVIYGCILLELIKYNHILHLIILYYTIIINDLFCR